MASSQKPTTSSTPDEEAHPKEEIDLIEVPKPEPEQNQEVVPKKEPGSKDDGILASAAGRERTKKRKTEPRDEDDSEQTLRLLSGWKTPSLPPENIISHGLVKQCSRPIRKQLKKSDVSGGEQSMLALPESQVRKKFLDFLKESETPRGKEEDSLIQVCEASQRRRVAESQRSIFGQVFTKVMGGSCEHEALCSCNNTPKIIGYVKKKIECCIEKYMSVEEIANYLQENYKITHHLTKPILEQLQRESPDFFKSYHLRCKLACQIEMFNDLLAKQAALMRESETPRGKEGARVYVYGPDGKVRVMTLCTHANEDSPELTTEWGKFVGDFELKEICDFVTVWMFRHVHTPHICLAIDTKRLSLRKQVSKRISKAAFED